MTQIVFQAAAIACCIYTAYRIVLFIVRKSRKTKKASSLYTATYLDCKPVGSRAQVYISKENHALIRRFLAVVAPNVPISGYVNKVVEEHLRNYRDEISQLHSDSISKPL